MVSLSSIVVNSCEPTAAVGTTANGCQLRLGHAYIQIRTPIDGGPSSTPQRHRQPCFCSVSTAMSSSTGPVPALRSCYQGGTHWMALRVTQRFPQMGFIQKAGIIPALPNMLSSGVVRSSRTQTDRVSPSGRVPAHRPSQGPRSRGHGLTSGSSRPRRFHEIRYFVVANRGKLSDLIRLAG